MGPVARQVRAGVHLEVNSVGQRPRDHRVLGHEAAGQRLPAVRPCPHQPCSLAQLRGEVEDVVEARVAVKQERVRVHAECEGNGNEVVGVDAALAL